MCLRLAILAESQKVFPVISGENLDQMKYIARNDSSGTAITNGVVLVTH
jgi:hypothetical protein